MVFTYLLVWYLRIYWYGIYVIFGVVFTYLLVWHLRIYWCGIYVSIGMVFRLCKSMVYLYVVLSYTPVNYVHLYAVFLWFIV